MIDLLLDEQIEDYRNKCIKAAQNPYITHPHTNYGSLHLEIFVKLRELNFAQTVNGKNIIELGTGAGPCFERLLQFGINSYTAVEPFHPDKTEQALKNHPKTSIAKTDGLSFLLSQPDNSAIILSFGVLCQELFFYNYNSLIENYFRFLIKEIYRVTPLGSPTIHVGVDVEEEKVFRAVGFNSLEYFKNSLWIKPTKTL